MAETMSAMTLAHLAFYDSTQGPFRIEDLNWRLRYLSEEEKRNTLEEFSQLFGIPMGYLTGEEDE